MKINSKDISIVPLISGDRGVSVLDVLIFHKFKIPKVILGKKEDLDLFKDKKYKNLEIIFQDNINDKSFVDGLYNLQFDYLIMSGFRQILKKNILNTPKKGTINLHAGKLPEYRGGSPLNWQMINGEEYAYISTILTDLGIDTGNILIEKRFEITMNDDIKSLHIKANNLFPEMVIDSIGMIEKGNKGKKQDEKNACYWHQRNDDDGYIDFKTSTSSLVVRTIRAITTPYPCAWGIVNGDKVRIIKAERLNFKLGGTPGKVVILNDHTPLVVCSEGAIKILDYKFEIEKDKQLTNSDRFE